MPEALSIILSLAVFAALVAALAVLNRKFKVGFTVRVLAALVLGTVFGISLQLIFGAETATGAGAGVRKWINILGSGFTKALQLVVVPLVLISIINAMSKLGGGKKGAKKAGIILAFLLITTAVSAVITIIVVRIFNLSASHLISFNKSAPAPSEVTDTILTLIPNSLFGALASTAVLPVVFIAVLIGFAYLSISKSDPKTGERFGSFLETAYAFIMKIVEFVIDFTPYGILAIISVRAASGSWTFIVQLGLIVIAAFAAMAVVFIMHLAIAWAGGVSPVRYLKKTATPLLFAFSSRSSAATLPLTIKSQRALGVSEANANLAGSLGTCIGQNGCAGVYPTMLAILVGLAQGWNVWSPAFLAPLILFVVIASVGTAGVGGGATHVSLMVLGLLGLPIELVAILISVDFIIDMGRTLINVSDSILAGYVTGKFEKDINKDLLFDKITLKEVEQREAEEKHAAENI
ncbi:MAG: cation:dicarboxylase symporter family transporter [Clostridiales bacterium]|jgi:L-cystine uptake protein TcyP (sodium:dicarboxylate symporter family)|nr:cation:dicarboxylase symporter family transporter [Clostridiales bacterium]